jgi:hypothetical protein
VSCCEISAKNFTNGQGRTNKRVLWMANKHFQIWKLGKEVE